MLSPKMQRTYRIHDCQIAALADYAFHDHSYAGFLQKRSGESNRWQLRWFVLYQNILFYYDSDKCSKPHGLLFLEHCYCNHLITPASFLKSKEEEVHCFAISFRRESSTRQYEFRAFSEGECRNWIDHIRQASFNKLLLQKEQLEQKHLHLLQVMESERTAKWQYTQQCEELVAEIKKLRTEMLVLKKQMNTSSVSLPSTAIPSSSLSDPSVRFENEPEELRKVRKVQSFFRGWLCRRRWKQIVEQYIKSPHAEIMRKRNSLVFRLVESEEEYVEQMEVLVSCFLRPFKMAASSKKPPCTHEDVNSIFLNSETVLFLHQIFFKGLSARLENWPTLVLGDLFNMLLPMLSIYQEYVRNHHYSLQVLTECKQSAAFAALVNRLENKAACRGRSLEAFLTYPMHQVPRYIIALHELLAHTPHDHVERKSLQHAREQLEELSRQMHDEVSETENLRKNLAIERMIVEGCDILLDVNQVFVRQGTLVQLLSDKPRSKLNFKTTDKEAIRQCFLFSNHLIIATRAANGKLNLVPNIGKLALADISLIEEPCEYPDDDASSTYSEASQSSLASTSEASSTSGKRVQNADFKIIIEPRTLESRNQSVIHFMAHTPQEKDAWVSDLNQCLFNVQFNDSNRTTLGNGAAQVFKTDPKLFKDEPDIRFSKTLNSYNIPQIRYATPERLLQRLTDLRFLSIDFLNTFLLTYRVYLDGVTVLEALKDVFTEGEKGDSRDSTAKDENTASPSEERRKSGSSPRRISGASSVSGYYSEMSERDRSHSYDSQGHRHWKSTMAKYEEESSESENAGSNDVQQQQLEQPRIVWQSPTHFQSKFSDSLSLPGQKSIAITIEKSEEPEDTTHLSIPKVTASSSSETLTDATLVSAPSSPGNLSSKTLVEGSSSDNNINEHESPAATTSQSPSAKETPKPAAEQNPTVSVKVMERVKSEETEEPSESTSIYTTSYQTSCTSSRSTSISGTVYQHYYGRSRKSIYEGETSSMPRASFQYDSPQPHSKAGVVITSSRRANRRSSNSSAAEAFAIATSAADNPRDISPNAKDDSKKDVILSSPTTMRVLTVLRHWISKHVQDFQSNPRLKSMAIEFLEEVYFCQNYLPAEHKTASQGLRLLRKPETDRYRVDVFQLVAIPATPTNENLESLTALEIAEQITYIDHHIFISISSEEFLGQAWMKSDKAVKAPHIILMTKRFNHVSRLVASEILKRTDINARIAAIEKWAAVADIERCLHNYNGVLQICAAFTNSAVFRLKKTWEKLSKTTKQNIDRLQAVVSSDGRFRALRDALHRCDPPCIPYLGLYLTDLSFIEEGTPTFVEDGLVNFSKMRMIAHVVREILHYQQTPYKIDFVRRVAHYLLDPSLLLEDDELYNRSLEIEPRASRLSTSGPSHSH